MALLQRLFQNRRNARQYNGSYGGQGEPSNVNLPVPKLDKSKIRLLIIGDTDKGRVPYFDSNAIHRIEEKQTDQQKKLFKSAAKLVPGCRHAKDGDATTVKNGVKYQFQRVGGDVKLLEEMMFGAVPMTYKGSTLKVHHIRSPPQLMVTKVFYPQKPKPESVSDLDSDSSSLPSSYTDQMASGDFSTPQRKMKSSQVTSIPVDVPLVHENLLDSMDDDSGLASLTSSGSFQSLFPSPSNNSASSYNSLHRRWMRSQTTSLLQRRWDSQETLNSPDSSQTHLPEKRKQIKLAIGILFTTGNEQDTEEQKLFQSFFFAHMALIEGHVERLRSTVEKAIFTGRNMVPSIYEALDKFRDALYDLYMAPRLREPVWLSMMSLGSYRYVLCERFVHEFMALAAKYDNKSTKFFVSTLLSAVLTYHLAWVATVTPGDGTPSKTYLDKHSAKWIDTLAKTHPYNPLWAQLGDLYGAIGYPLKVARTVVVGRKADIVKKFLYVLSYFIRCSDVHEAPYVNCLPSILDGQWWEATTPVTLRGVSVEEGSPFSPMEANPPGPFKSEGVLSPKRTVNFEMHDLHYEGDMHRTHSEMNVSCHRGADAEHSDAHVDLSHSQPDRTEADNRSTECRVLAVGIVEDSRVESIPHLQRSMDSLNRYDSLPPESDSAYASLNPDSLGVDSKLDSNTKRPLSVLAQQLAADRESNTNLEQQKLKMSEVRKQFLSGGSSISMYDEYYDGVTETKTIDMVSEEQRVVKHPLACSAATSSTSSKGEVWSGETGSSQQKVSVSRQNSVDTKPHVSRPTSLNPARCRSVTPTELERRRHLSSTSSVDMDTFDPLLHCQETSMPELKTQGEQSSIEAYDQNFGRSLLAGYSDHYMSDFVLHGTSDTSFRQKLLQDLQATMQHSILDEPVAESVCIIADTDNWTVEVANTRLLEMCSSGTMPWTTSQLVASLIESVLDLHRLKMSAEFCIMHLEDRLQEMYFKSLMLAEYIKGVQQHNQHQLTQMLGFDASDLPLLLAIAGTHTPNLALGV
ncbi:hypothetical protein BaRGS_00037851 [Batillaria attramentaria]|uniref:UDENN FNIP1/2-type domain-containing protein n=1 Tax=Batillaria attramentaria TaxID=370345 RepID=A0ABD0J7Q1_9CAEN